MKGTCKSLKLCIDKSQLEDLGDSGTQSMTEVQLNHLDPQVWFIKAEAQIPYESHVQVTHSPTAKHSVSEGLVMGT